MDDHGDSGLITINMGTSSMKHVMSITDCLISAHINAQHHYHWQSICNQDTIEELLSSAIGIIPHCPSQYLTEVSIIIKQ